MQIRQTVRRVSWTMLDQGLVSAGNFLLTVSLARNLAREDYGAFALIFGAFLALQVFNSSLLSYPLSIRLPLADARDKPRLVATNLVLAIAACLPLGAVLAGGLAFWGRGDAILPVIAAFVALQGQEALRRCLLSEFRHRDAIIGDAVAYLGPAGLVAILASQNDLTLATAFSAMAATFALGTAIQAWQLRLSITAAGDFAHTVRDYWASGAYALANNLVSLLRLQLPIWVLAGMTGSAATASFQAALNVVNLANPIIIGLCNIIPQAAASARRSGNGEAWRLARVYALLGAPATFGFYALVLAAPGTFLLVFYGAQSPYLDETGIVRILIAAWAINYFTDMVCSYLHGVDDARTAFGINVIGVVTTAVLALPLVATWGLVGAAWVLLATSAVRFFAAQQLLTRTVANEGPA